MLTTWSTLQDTAIGPEAEEAILIEPLEADVQQRKGEERVICFGRTKGGDWLRFYTSSGAEGSAW